MTPTIGVQRSTAWQASCIRAIAASSTPGWIGSRITCRRSAASRGCAERSTAGWNRRQNRTGSISASSSAWQTRSAIVVKSGKRQILDQRRPMRPRQLAQRFDRLRIAEIVDHIDRDGARPERALHIPQIGAKLPVEAVEHRLEAGGADRVDLRAAVIGGHQHPPPGRSPSARRPR